MKAFLFSCRSCRAGIFFAPDSTSLIIPCILCTVLFSLAFLSCFVIFLYCIVWDFTGRGARVDLRTVQSWLWEEDWTEVTYRVGTTWLWFRLHRSGVHLENDLVLAHSCSPLSFSFRLPGFSEVTQAAGGLFVLVASTGERFSFSRPCGPPPQ